jgi:multidrug efflux system outer membrane protein
MKTVFFLLGLGAAASAVAAVSSSNPSSPAAAAVPEAYRDIAWTAAAPADALERGEWWQLFGDESLDRLERLALAANQDLRAAAARVEQARAAAGIARGSYWPQLAAGASATREQTSDTTDNVVPHALTTTYRAPLSLAWELDLFGRVRHLSASARAEAEGSEAAFAAVRLALTADVAANYFSLRALERETALLRDTIALRRRALELMTSRRQIGAAGDVDVARAETELASAEAESAALAIRRATLQNALAVLAGAPAPAFEISNLKSEISNLPAVPAGLPSTLLERRPDVAAAERALAAAQERIGVAKAAFFPAISLTGSAGFASGDIDRLFQADSRVWSIGPSVYLPIFQGGRNRANLERSRAAHEEAVAVFRQRVLVAFREVQDALTSAALLETQTSAQDRAVAAARRAAALAQTRYDAGLVAYFEVIDAQRTLLAAERAAAQLAAQNLNTRVALIKALGGGWHAPARFAAR